MNISLKTEAFWKIEAPIFGELPTQYLVRGQEYNQIIPVSGGPPPTLRVADGSSLPSDLRLVAETRMITGTPLNSLTIGQTLTTEIIASNGVTPSATLTIEFEVTR